MIGVGFILGTEPEVNGVGVSFLNQHEIDRVVRILLGLVILALGWSGFVTDLWGVAMRLLGWFPLVTGLIGWCPLYALFDFSTRRNGALSSKAGT